MFSFQICPALLSKKDRGRSSDPKARPKAFGEVTVSNDVPGADLLLEYQQRSKPSDGSDVDEDDFTSDSGRREESGDDDDDDDSDSNVGSLESEEGTIADGSEEEEEDDDDEEEHVNGSEEGGEEEDNYEEEEDDKSENNDENSGGHDLVDAARGGEVGEEKANQNEYRLHKRKQPEPDIPISTDSSLGALRRLVSTKMEDVTPVDSDGILSNEEFQLIKKLKVCFSCRLFFPYKKSMTVAMFTVHLAH